MKIKISRRAIVVWTIIASIFGVGLKFGVLDRSWLEDSEDIVVTPDPSEEEEEVVVITKEEKQFVIVANHEEVSSFLNGFKTDIENELTTDEYEYTVVVQSEMSEDADVFIGSVDQLIGFDHFDFVYSARYPEDNDEIYFVKKYQNYALDDFSELIKTNIGVYTPLSLIDAYIPLLDSGVKPGSNTGLVSYDGIDELTNALRNDEITSVALSELVYQSLTAEQKQGLSVYRTVERSHDLVIAYKKDIEINPFDTLVMDANKDELVTLLNVAEISAFQDDAYVVLFNNARRAEIYR